MACQDKTGPTHMSAAVLRLDCEACAFVRVGDQGSSSRHCARVEMVVCKGQLAAVQGQDAEAPVVLPVRGLQLGHVCCTQHHWSQAHTDQACRQLATDLAQP